MLICTYCGGSGKKKIRMIPKEFIFVQEGRGKSHFEKAGIITQLPPFDEWPEGEAPCYFCNGKGYVLPFRNFIPRTRRSNIRTTK